jgi:DNA-binding CsgD family transcriptional regulator
VTAEALPTSTGLSAPLTQEAAEPDAGDSPAVVAGVVDALNDMIVEARGGRLEVARESLDGISVVLQRANIRCVLNIAAVPIRQRLSPRELQIARLVADGATNRQIAGTLDISSWTVSTHIRRIFAKLGVSNRAEMVAQLFGLPRR